jgi:hypothetical protein
MPLSVDYENTSDNEVGFIGFNHDFPFRIEVIEDCPLNELFLQYFKRPGDNINGLSLISNGN